MPTPTLPSARQQMRIIKRPEGLSDAFWAALLKFLWNGQHDSGLHTTKTLSIISLADLPDDYQPTPSVLNNLAILSTISINPYIPEARIPALIQNWRDADDEFFNTTFAMGQMLSSLE